MKLVHLSDILVWRYTWHPARLTGARMLGVIELLRGRAARYALERLDEVVARVKGLDPDHILITGDLTTTALPAEFADAKRELGELLSDPARVTVVPGNHDRYTNRSLLERRFEAHFGEFLGAPRFPWLRWIDRETAILGLDATRAHVSPRGYLPPAQLAAAGELLAQADRPRRLIVASHYPVAAPPLYRAELAFKRIKNQEEVVAWLRGIGRHVFCCGHVHAAWAFAPPELPDQLCLNAGAPILRDPTGLRPPGFLEITLEESLITVTHQAWDGREWQEITIWQDPVYFPAPAEEAQRGGGAAGGLESEGRLSTARP